MTTANTKGNGGNGKGLKSMEEYELAEDFFTEQAVGYANLLKITIRK